MAIKPHLKLNTKKQADKPEVLKFNYGFGKEEDNAQEEPNYFPMARSFRRLGKKNCKQIVTFFSKLF